MVKNKKAEMGMGTLVIFIALILVSAVVSSVIISTTSKVQNKALATGSASTIEIGTSLIGVELYAENASNQFVDRWYETIKLTAGSGALKLTDTLLTFALHDGGEDYIYNSNINCSNTSTFNESSLGFGVHYKVRGPDNQDGYLVRGDVVLMCWTSQRPVGESETFKATLIPKVGTTVVIETTLPDLMLTNRVLAFP